MSDVNSPSPPDSLPQYLADGVPNQDDATLPDLREYVDELLAYRAQPVDEEDLPNDADPAEINDDDGRGTVVKEVVTCGDDSCHCMSGDKKHGPYLYRYYYTDDSLTSEYIRKPEQ